MTFDIEKSLTFSGRQCPVYIPNRNLKYMQHKIVEMRVKINKPEIISFRLQHSSISNGKYKCTQIW